MSLTVSKNAVGMLWRTMNALAKSLEDSSCAAALVGPKILRPAARNASTTPAASGASGPTTVSSMASRLTNPIRSGMAVMATFSTPSSKAVPALPGATYTFCTLAPCARRHASACSRPPEPMTSIFMLILFSEKREKGEEGRGKGKTGTCRYPSPFSLIPSLMLMPEVPVTGKHHRQPMLVRRGDHFLVAHRAARLDHGLGTGLRQHVDAVAEREEGIGRHHRVRQAQARILRLDAGDARAVHAAHLSCADAQGLAALAEHDGVGLHVLGDTPCEQQVLQLFGGRLRPGHDQIGRASCRERV